MSEPALVRDCDGCTMCCKVFSIEPLQKPRDVWCTHCTIGKGCGIYETRPEVCRSFYCGYLADPEMGEEWKPSNAKFVLVIDKASTLIAVHVDPARAESWRREPYYSTFKKWSRQMAAVNKQVVVFISGRATVILPEKDVELGVLTPDEQIVTQWVRTPAGPRYEAFKWRKDDPRLTKRSQSLTPNRLRIG